MKRPRMHAPQYSPLPALGVIVLCALALATACGGGSPLPDDGIPVVAVSVQPQAYFVDRIAGGRFRTLVLIGPGQSPHGYEPTPRQMSDLARASIWFTVGADFEKGILPKASSLYPGMTLADTTVGVVYRTMEEHSHDGEAEDGEHGDESPGGPDPHVWLGRQAVKAQAAVILEALSRADPAHAGEFAANHARFVADLDRVFDGLAADLAPLEGSTAFVYHPAFGYFLDEFGIRQEAVETGGKEPTARALAALIEEARADGARVIFVQAQFPAAAAETVAEAIGGRALPIDPLAPDWLDNLRRMGDALRESIP